MEGMGFWEDVRGSDSPPTSQGIWCAVSCLGWVQSTAPTAQWFYSTFSNYYNLCLPGETSSN